MEINKEYFEAILKRKDNESNVVLVTDVIENSVVEKGENYTSDTVRLIAKVIDGARRRKEVKFIAKFAPTTPAKLEFIMELGLFSREIKFYRDVRPCMEALLEECGDYSDRLWPDCLDYKCYSTLVLEDLSTSDYRMADRKEGLDFEHAALALASLAKLHALSVVLKDRNELDVSDFNYFAFCHDSPVMEGLIAKGIEAVRKVIQGGWGREWSGILRDMEGLEFDGLRRIRKVCTRDENAFNVLCHGDPWTNNMLFKYCPYTGKVIGIKLVDFQLVHYDSYALDINYTLYTSVRGSALKDKDKLLAVYHSTLKRTFEMCNHVPKNMPTLEDVKKEVRAKAFFGVTIAISMLHLFTGDKEQARDLEEMVINPNLDVSADTLATDVYNTRAQDILRSFKDTKFFSSVAA